MNEQREIFEMASPFAFKLLRKIETGNGLFYFHACILNLPDTTGLGLLNGYFFPVRKGRKGWVARFVLSVLALEPNQS